VSLIVALNAWVSAKRGTGISRAGGSGCTWLHGAYRNPHYHPYSPLGASQ
jgi:hypothetical protein